MKVWIISNEKIKNLSDEVLEIKRLLAEGDKMGINIEVYHPKQFDLINASHNQKSILIDGEHNTLPEFILPRALLLESDSYTLAIIRKFESLGVYVYNTSDCIQLVSDKFHMHHVLNINGLPTPTTVLTKFPINVDMVENKIGFPIVVKTLLGIIGTGVFLMETREKFENLMSLIEETNKNIKLILQKFISESSGRVIQLFVLNGKVVASLERRTKQGGFNTNIRYKSSVAKILPEKIAIMLSEKTAKVLNVQIACIELLYNLDGYLVCGVNVFPSFKSFESTFEGLNLPYLIFKDMNKKRSESQS